MNRSTRGPEVTARVALYERLQKQLENIRAETAVAMLRWRKKHESEQHRKLAQRMIDLDKAREELSRAIRTDGPLYLPQFPPLELDEEDIFRPLDSLRNEPLLAKPVESSNVGFDDLQPPEEL